jgi:hypothetical protein
MTFPFRMPILVCVTIRNVPNFSYPQTLITFGMKSVEGAPNEITENSHQDRYRRLIVSRQAVTEKRDHEVQIHDRYRQCEHFP